MKAIERLKVMIIDGEISQPKTSGGLVSLLETALFISDCKDDIEDKVKQLKHSFLSMYKIKSGGERSCYISRIKDGMLSGKNKKFNDVFKSLYGVDAIEHVIKQLIVEDKIKVIGKKVYLIGVHNER